MAADRRPGLLGRTSERELLDQLLANVRQGQSAVLVVRGEAGVGKTAVLRYVARQASGFRVARIGGVEAEMELPFAGVHQLCAPILKGDPYELSRRPTVHPRRLRLRLRRAAPPCGVHYVRMLSNPDSLRGSFGWYRALDTTIAQDEQRKTTPRGMRRGTRP